MIRVLFALVLIVGCASVRIEAASVWKVNGPNGQVLYLGGSVHALRGTDYPLPAAYNRAMDASSKLVMEVDPKALVDSSKGLAKAGEYRKGDNLKNHVDRRTYDYVRRFFALFHVPEAKFSTFRPWYIALMLESPVLYGASEDLGIEEYLVRRAKAAGKPIGGLESAIEHARVYSELTDKQGEAYLLIFFIPVETDKKSAASSSAAWRSGDADALSRSFHARYQDFPSLAERLIDNRNRNWIPKIEGYLSSGQTYFVVVGAAHLGGPGGVLALVRERGYKIEQL